MTEIEELIELMAPELLVYFKAEENCVYVQKELDNNKEQSVCCDREATEDDD